MNDKASATRARQACEPCRRKKTKCPGEKPVCSFCQRLGQRCSYERADTATSSRIRKPQRSDSQDSHGSKDRLQRLESRIEEVFDILGSITNRTTTQSSSTPPTVTRATEGPLTRSVTPTRESPTPDAAPKGPRFDAVRSQEPPVEIWSQLIEIYKQRFDCQPISVLTSHTFSIPTAKWPKCLRRSFLSLTIPFVQSHSFYNECLSDAILFYTKTARQEILASVADGIIGAEILQSICLSALREIIGCNPLGSWMNTSIGIRLALATGIMSNTSNPRIVIDADLRSRCCWSLFALDRFYGTTLTIPPTLSTEDALPGFPESAPCPNTPNDLPQQMPLIKDLGVYANYLQLLSIWGMVMKYIKSVKDSEQEEAWTVESQYHKIMARVFDFETKYNQMHRFQQTRMQERDVTTLESQRKYWAPWLAGQFMFHAIQGLINHPYIHITSKSRRQVFQPPSFLQASIDQAVLHSSWILKCIEVCTETGFRIYDPFIAHLVAVTATIYLFLLNAKDEELASQSRLGFERCYSFIQSMGENWPHLRHTIDKLDILQHAAITNPSVPTNPSAPKAQRSLLWELLDYSASTTPSQVPEFASDAVDLNVDTRFLSPLNPLSTGHTPAAAVPQNNVQNQQSTNNQRVDAIWDPSIDSFGFNLFDNEQMADLTNMTFGRDIWGFGQL